VILIAEIEGFHSIINSLSLAKKLHDIGRHDVLAQFDELLCWDNYYSHVMDVTSSIFSGFKNDYADDDETEYMEFEDDVISNYFIHAWKYGKYHNIHYSQNPYVTHAKDEAHNCLNTSCCIDWKLLAYIRTQKSAQKSKLIVCMGNGCGGCCGHENLSHGLIRLYTWFKNKCDELASSSSESKTDAFVICVKSEHPEVMAA
jgi:hypothetical protein